MEEGGCPNTTFKDLPSMSQLHSISPRLLKDRPPPSSARVGQPNLYYPTFGGQLMSKLEERIF